MKPGKVLENVGKMYEERDRERTRHTWPELAKMFHGQKRIIISCLSVTCILMVVRDNGGNDE